MRFSKKEIKDLFFAWILISIAFAVLFSFGTVGLSFQFFVVSFFVSLLTAGEGFLFHELMHKIVAQKYGLFAEFRAFYKMIFLAIGLAFLGFIFAAPGAVEMRGKITSEINGKISLAGPLTNIALAILFFIPLRFSTSEGIVQMIFEFGFRINSLLALFNMIPITPFDGAKVFVWNKRIFYMVLVFALLLFVIGMFF